MKNVISSVYQWLLAILIIAILIKVDQNNKAGKQTNLGQEAGRVIKQGITDFKTGWNTPGDSDTTESTSDTTFIK